LTLGRDAKSKLARVLVVGNLAAFLRPHCGTAFALEQFDLAELPQVGEVVDIVASRQASDLLALGGDYR